MTWVVSKECGSDRKGMKGRDVVDLLYAFFFDTEFNFKITTGDEEKQELKLPVFEVSGNKNTTFIRDKETLLEASRATTIKKKREYWLTWFGCFAHPLIYLEYEKNVLFTRKDKRFSMTKKEDTDDKQLKKCYDSHFLTFCKIRTKFLKCYDHTVAKPSYFCRGVFSKLDLNNKEVVALIEKLGYSDMKQDLVNFEGNANADPDTRKKEIKTLEQSIEDAKQQLEKLISERDEKELNEELEMDLDLDPEMEKEEPKTEFGKKTAFKAVSSVIGMWKSGNKKDAVKLFKMCNSNPAINRNALHKFMEISRPLF